MADQPAPEPALSGALRHKARRDLQSAGITAVSCALALLSAAASILYYSADVLSPGDARAFMLAAMSATGLWLLVSGVQLLRGRRGATSLFTVSCFMLIGIVGAIFSSLFLVILFAYAFMMDRLSETQPMHWLIGVAAAVLLTSAAGLRRMRGDNTQDTSGSFRIPYTAWRIRFLVPLFLALFLLISFLQLYTTFPDSQEAVALALLLAVLILPVAAIVYGLKGMEAEVKLGLRPAGE